MDTPERQHPDDLTDAQILALPQDEAVAFLVASERISEFEAKQMLETLAGGDVFEADTSESTPQAQG